MPQIAANLRLLNPHGSGIPTILVPIGLDRGSIRVGRGLSKPFWDPKILEAVFVVVETAVNSPPILEPTQSEGCIFFFRSWKDAVRLLTYPDRGSCFERIAQGLRAESLRLWSGRAEVTKVCHFFGVGTPSFGRKTTSFGGSPKKDTPTCLGLVPRCPQAFRHCG